jgi:isochorismate pyruvate lyase
MDERAFDCESLEEIRAQIDAIDRKILVALRARWEYVKAASRFKPSEESIPAPDRVARMLPVRRAWAEELGLNPDFVERLSRQIIEWFIEQQIRHWRQTRAK